MSEKTLLKEIVKEKKIETEKQVESQLETEKVSEKEISHQTPLPKEEKRKLSNSKLVLTVNDWKC